MGVVALLVTIAMVFLGLQSPSAQAAPAPHATPDFTAVCPASKPGQFTCFALRRNDVPAVKGLMTKDASPTGYGAGDLESAYNLPANGGAGQTIAIVDAQDDPAAEADLAIYRAQYGLPACTSDDGCFTKVSQRGGTDYPLSDTAWAGEISLDLDMVSAAAPLAHILLVEADTASTFDLGASVDEAVTLGAKYVSNSYGSPYTSAPGSGEYTDETTTLDPYYNHPGVAIVASSGDSAYGVTYPASSQYVTSVGGTSLLRAPGAGRGWAESVWKGSGSGCSAFEPKPAFQSDTGCDHRAVADVSAVADPLTGLAVYQTYGAGGWTSYGGTSASAPLITGVYAAAGTPTAGTYPNSYPYHAGGAGLNDVTSGNNGTCTPSYLCAAGPGYDGPTGVGTPDGLAAFRDGPHGVVSGTVTEAGTGAPLPGVTVTVGKNTTHTGPDGRYTETVPVGTYSVGAAAYGYTPAASVGVTITDGASLTANLTLKKERTRAVSGRVDDGSGQGWPLYARITVDDVPGAPVWTDPYTGAYQLSLPEGHSYTLHVTSAYSGYRTSTASVALGGSSVHHDFALPVDRWSGTISGYTVKDAGSTDGFDSDQAPNGWSVTNASGTNGGWEFNDPAALGNRTGGSGAFAEIDSDKAGPGARQDSSLISPDYNFSADSGPELTFRTDYAPASSQSATVDASTDGGATWSTVWSPPGFIGPAQITVPLAAYAHDPRVRFRFHFTASYGWTWEVDDVFVGDRTLQAVPGGLVAGTVTDSNTGTSLNAAEITGPSGSGLDTVSIATPDDSALADGFYWLFAPTRTSSFTAAKRPYAPVSQKVKVRSGGTVKTRIALKAGRLKVKQTSVSATARRGEHITKTLTIKNTGGAPATVSLAERPGEGTGSLSAPLSLVKGDFSPQRSTPETGPAASKPQGTSEPDGSGSLLAWQTAQSLPVAVSGNAVDVHNGKLYSAVGRVLGLSSGSSKNLYTYSPTSGTWTQLASPAHQREAPAHGFIGDKLYLAGGWTSILTTADRSVEIYDTASNTWSFGANNPEPLAAPGSGVIDGKLYSVGGCTLTVCGNTSVTVYDPAADSWSSAADYPEPTAWTSCGAIVGKLYCAGGSTDSGPLKSAYVYDPATDSWSPLPDLPETLWGSATAAANGQLLVSSGIIGGELSNQAFAYDPAVAAWRTLPNVNQASYRAGGAPGFYQVGGEDASGAALSTVEVLPGYDQLNSADVTWLSESTQRFTVRPGASVRLTLTLDGDIPKTPGTYTARLLINSDTPYQTRGVPVSLTTTRPNS